MYNLPPKHEFLKASIHLSLAHQRLIKCNGYIIMKFILSFLLLLSSIFTNAHVYNCNSTEDILLALSKVKAGDEIIINSGVYVGKSLKKGAYYYSNSNGTENSPIVIKKKEKAGVVKLKGFDVNRGAILRISGNHWVIDGLDLSVGQKGLVFDKANNNKVINCRIYKIGNEAIHIRDGSNHTIIDSCKIFDTGNLNAGFGEGIYIGTDRKAWKKYNPSCNNTIVQNCEIGPNVRAEAIDIKEGTQESIIQNNLFNGLGISGHNSANSFISVKGVNNIIRENVFDTKGNSNIEKAIAITYRYTVLSGYKNRIYDNIFNMNSQIGKIVQANLGTTDTYVWNNTRNPKGELYSSNVRHVQSKFDNDSTVVYNDDFKSKKSKFLGLILTKNINLSISKEGEVKLEMKPEATLPPYSPIMYRFPKPLDFSNNAKIVVRVKSLKSFKLRFDLHDGTNATNGSRGRVTRVIPAGLNKWTDLEFTYPEEAFLDNNVNKSSIKRINIQLDSGKENFPSALYVDFIKVIQASKETKSTKNKIVFKPSKKYVILKMDDLRANTNHSYNKNWQELVNTIRRYKIKAALGLIAEDLPKASQSYKDSLKQWHDSEFFEIWNHGWNHKRKNYPPYYNNKSEYSGTSYEFQKECFEKSMALAKSELGITMKTFGAPFNQTDDSFFKVIEENKDIKVWLYGRNNSYSGLILKRGTKNQLESATGVVSYNSFLTAFQNNKTPYLVLQGHPGKWDENSFLEFDRVINFLKKQEVIFVLPHEYYEIIN